MKSFRFLHAADIHLDSPLQGLTQHDNLSIETIRSASRRALDRLVEIAIEKDVAFIVIAGDLYDGNWKSISTGHYMASALGRLIDHNIRVFLLRGNHDAASVLTHDMPFSEKIECFPSPRPGTFLMESIGVALHGQSFKDRHVVQDMTPSYPKPLEGYFNIGVLHTSLSGHGNHDVYAPCSKEGLRAKGYQYWALGHVHDRQIHTDGTPIVFPGVLQGRHSRETGEKGVILVSVTDHVVDRIEPIACDTVRWHKLHFDCTPFTHKAAFEDRLGASLKEIAYTHPDHLNVVRVILSGETALHDLLRRLGPALRDDMHTLAALNSGKTEIEIEKLILQTKPPAKTLSMTYSGEDGVALAALVRQAAGDDTFLASLGAELDQCLRSLDLGDIAPDSLLGRIGNRQWESLLPDLGEDLCDRLSGLSEESQP